MKHELWRTQIPLKPKHLWASSKFLCLAAEDSLHFLSPIDGTYLLPSLTTLGELPLTEYSLVGGAVALSGSLLLTLLPSRLSGKASLWALELHSTDEEKNIICKRLYEAPSAQLSTPVIENNTVCLIQSGPELVVLNIDSGKVQHTFSLPSLDNLHRNCVSFTFTANRFLLALCDGMILALDPDTGQILTTLREPDELTLSPLVSDGMHLFFGTSVNRKNPSPSYVYAVNVISGQKMWSFEMPPDHLGRHRPVEGRPLIVKDGVYLSGHNHYLQALDINTGQQRWYHQMPNPIRFGPVCAGNAVIAVDQEGNIQAFQNDAPIFAVTCHYDLKTPPILNEWHPLILMLINTSNVAIQNTVLRLSGDFEGKSEHHTQQFYMIPSGEVKICTVDLKPTAAGTAVYLRVVVEYQRGSSPVCQEKLELTIPVRRARNDRFDFIETSISPDGEWQYNYLALRALLTAAFTANEVDRLCFEQFRPIYDTVAAGTDKHKKIRRLVEYVDQHQQVELLLEVVQQRHPALCKHYLPEIKWRVSEPDEPDLDAPAPNFDVFLAHNHQDRDQVEAIARVLRQRGLQPWLDKEQIPPGRWFQEVIQQAITEVKSAAIVIGPHGLGKWQVVELRSFISRCVEKGLPVIPVLLPGVDEVPVDLPFLKELHSVRFARGIDDTKALDDLEWGITGQRRSQKNLNGL